LRELFLDFCGIASVRIHLEHLLKLLACLLDFSDFRVRHSEVIVEPRIVLILDLLYQSDGGLERVHCS